MDGLLIAHTRPADQLSSKCSLQLSVPENTDGVD